MPISITYVVLTEPSNTQGKEAQGSGHFPGQCTTSLLELILAVRVESQVRGGGQGTRPGTFTRTLTELVSTVALVYINDDSFS